MDQIKLLCDISELNHLFRESVSIENFLHQTVKMVTHHLKTDVCSIYLYDDEEDNLIMRATEGLNPDSVDHVSMKITEGLTGKALREMQPVCVSKASRHPDYKLFVGTDEEQFDNFLAVPITRGPTKIGVLTLQRKKKSKFREEDILACKAVASQLANIIENAKFLMSMHIPHEDKYAGANRTVVPAGLEFIRGKVASEGYSIGPIRIIDSDKTFSMLSEKEYETEYTLEDFEQAVNDTEEQLEDLQKEVEEQLTDAASLIFASHLLILKDKEFIGQMRNNIKVGVNPPEAVISISRNYINIFLKNPNQYFREKAKDVEDLAVRILTNLVGRYQQLADIKGKIIIAKDLFPSDLLRLSSEKVAGVILVSGGVTSHVSILARSLMIPMVIANNPDLLLVPDDTRALVDADTGNLYIDPADEVIDSFNKRNADRLTIQDQIQSMKPQTHTSDGTRISLMANINLLSDLKHAQQLLCEGVGLYRTEFPFIIRNDFPTEQEQFFAYRKLVEGMTGKPVTFRTLDIGGDKVLSYYHNAREQNPGMGMRSIRFSLGNQKIFIQQLRAMLRAGHDADLKIMFPMISSVDDYHRARDILNEAAYQLKHEEAQFNKNPSVGIMVELPSVIHIIEELAKEVDFFSIGTNDFIQFMLGVDRTNETVESFYIPHHPAVFRAIKQVVDAASRHNTAVSICGDMAHQVQYISVLLGLGIRILSIDPIYMPKLQKTISKIDIGKADELAQKILEMSSVDDIVKLLGIRRLI